MTTDDQGEDVTSDTRPRMEPQEALAELGAIVLGQPLGVVLRRIADLVVACIPGADEVSVTLVDGDKTTSAAFTGSLAASLDERQYDDGFGPCLDAARSGQHLRIDDTAHEELYAGFAAAAARQGVRSTLSIGLPMPQRVLGAINVYRFGAEPLDAEAEQLATAFAGYAAVALANAALYASTADLAVNLQTAMNSRAVIEQAKGVLVGRLGCTPEEAFTHLATQSQHQNRKLRDIATEVVENAAGRPGH
ncbi:GAF and ANTAR domain-containing protein [Kineococcus sp. R86509]|uniref:GAF and ANTAR domain-containing protein n=1 Tax=Kineococcus sp. R86509 TaxID=3093851 RepID=UPI0036D29570